MESPTEGCLDDDHFAHKPSRFVQPENELNGVFPPDEPASISPSRPSSTPGRTTTQQRLEKDSWRSNQLSPTGIFFDPIIHASFRPEDNFPTLFTESSSDHKSFGQMHLPMTAEATCSFITYPPPKQFSPCFPSLRNRYNRGVAVNKNSESWRFSPLETFTAHDVYCDRRWIPNTHPEGQLYFSSARKDGQHLYLTEEHLYEQRFVDEVEQLIKEFEKRLNDFGDKLSAVIDIFVSFDEVGDEGWYYYCVDTARRCLFWIDEVDLTWMAETVGSVPTKAHFKYGLDFEYWMHVEHFPFHQILPENLVNDLMGTVIHQSADAMTSLDSTVPFPKEEIQNLVELANHISALKRANASNGFVVVAAARLMTVFVNGRFFHFAGQHGARLSITQSIRGDTQKRTILIRFISPFLLYTPETYRNSLETIYVDKTIKARLWQNFATSLVDDFQRCMICSTVLLTADLSFLAIPGIVQIPTSSATTNIVVPPAAIAAEISLIASIGSIIAALLLTNRLKRQASDTAQVVADFLHRKGAKDWGLEILSVQYCIPYALVMWGIIAFLVAVGLAGFKVIASGIVGSTSIGLAWGSVFLMIIFIIVGELEARMSLRWNQYKFRWSRWFKRMAWWRKKSKEEEEEMEMDRQSVATSDAGSVRSRRARIRLDFFMRRKKDSRRDTVFDLMGR